MTWDQKIQRLKFEAELYELYASKIEQVKVVLKSFDGKQANVRITVKLQEEIPWGDCSVWADKEENNLRICFASPERAINVGTANNCEWAYASNNRDSILCVDAVKLGRLDYQAAEPQIDKEAAGWLSAAKTLKTTDYTALFDDYQEIADRIKDFRDNVDYRIRYLLDLDFHINHIRCR